MLESRGRVESVTLYRGQALVARAVPVDAPAGAVQLTVPGLPDSIVGDSLFASSGDDLQIRAVHYRERATGEAPEAEVRELDEQIADAEKAIRANDAKMQLVQSQRAYLDKLEAFSAPSAQAELKHGVLDADTLDQLTEMIFARRTEAARGALQALEERITLDKRLDLLRRKRAELGGKYSKTLREAVIYLDKIADGKSELRLNYLVNNATWTPAYNLRSNSEMTAVEIEYGGLVYQATGEDWAGVSLKLSTAGAQMAADGPVLVPLRLTLSVGPRQEASASSIIGKKSEMRSKDMMRRSAVGYRRQVAAQAELNWFADEAQAGEYNTRPEDIPILRDTVKETGLSVDYNIGGSVTIVSRPQNQIVQIAKLNVPAAFHYEAVPLLSEYAYRYAQIENTSNLSLLGGRANVYLNGEFVGKTDIPLLARGQKISVGFGTNPQLRVSRELVSKDTKQHMWSNQEVACRYRLVLENYGDKPVRLRVLDRVPVETDALKVVLGEMKEPLSDDQHYQRTLRPKGILRWDIDVPAGAALDKARSLEYSYALIFSKDLRISTGGERNDGRDAPAERMREISDLYYAH